MQLVVSRVHGGARRVFYGWWIVAGAFVVHALSGGLLFHAFGAYFVHIQAEFGWSRTIISGSFSLARLEGGFLGPFQGWMIDRMGARAVVRVGLIVFCLGLVLISRVDSVPIFYAAFLVVAIGSGLCGFLTLNIVLANWFERRRTTAIALAATGSSVGGLMVPLVAWALNTFGWRTTAFCSGLLLLLLGLPVAQLIRHAPEAYGYAPDGRRAPGMPAGGDGSRPVAAPLVLGGLTAREALRTPAFWLLSTGHSTALLAISALSAHLIPFLVEQLHLGLEAAAAAVAGITAVSFVSHLFGGFIGDRMNKRLLTTLCMGGHTAGLLVLASAATPVSVFVFALLHGLAWGIRGPLMTAIRADYFGRRSLPTIEGFASLVTTLGLVAGPISTGFLADWLSDYHLAFFFLATVTAIGALCFGLAARPPGRGGAGRASPDSPSSAVQVFSAR